MLTDEQLLAIMPRVSVAKRGELLPFLQAAMTECAIDKVAREAAFLAQLAHESGEFRFMEEIWGPTDAQRRYEPPSTLAAKLGNTELGDGKRFKGRGPIQITGRANYRRFGGLLGIDLVSDPGRAARPDLAFRIAGLFWVKNGLNELADRANADAFREITKCINGGLNGLKDRERFYAVARAVLGVTDAPLTPGAESRRRIPVAPGKPVFERGHEAIRALSRSERTPKDIPERKTRARRTKRTHRATTRRTSGAARRPSPRSRSKSTVASRSADRRGVYIGRPDDPTLGKPREASMAVRVATKVRKKSTALSEAKSSSGAIKASRPAAEGAATATRAADEGRYTVAIRYRVDDRVEDLQLTTDDRSFYPFAQRWRYVVANRRRITRATRDSLSTDISVWMSDVCELEPSSFETRVKWMARSEVVEVSIPYTKESVGWAARLFPWENALGLLTRPFREETAPFTVVRHLSAKKTRLADTRPGSLLVVRSGPGEIGSRYDLERECQMVVDTLRPVLPTGSDSVLREPDRSALDRDVKTLAPAIVHLSGVDPYALEAQGILKVDPENTDGFVLRKADGGAFDIVNPSELAAIVTGGATKPLLVALTSCFSASRIAALSVSVSRKPIA